MEQKTARRNYWECRNDTEIYRKLIGFEYGENPIQVKNAIEAEKAQAARWIAQHAQVNQNSIGLEIGTGTGFVIKEMTKMARFVYGCDISQSFLDYAQKECSETQNVSFHLLSKTDFNFLPESGIDFVYSNNVFIHLDLFEITDYIEAVHTHLKIGGFFWFDLLDAELINSPKDPDFLSSRKYRHRDPYNKSVLQYNSVKAVQNMAEKLDYEVKIVATDNRCNTKFLLRKLGRKS